jgi:chromate transporter
MKDLETEKEQQVLPATRPSPWRLLWIWTMIGTQSFGGGSATVYLIRRVTVERYGWLTDSEFTRYWSICQITPGINILALVILIGWRVGGALGAVLTLSGLLVPSAAITIALTSAYVHFREAPLVRAAIGGVVPATVGLGLLLAYSLVRPLLNAAWREGRATTLIAAMLLLGSLLVAALVRPPAVTILWTAGALSAVAQWQRVARRRRPQ